MELVRAGWTWRGADKKLTEADLQILLEIWGLIWLELSPKTFFLLILPGFCDQLHPKTNVLQIYLDFMIQMCNNCEKRGPESPKRLQYGPKAPLGASGGVLGRARGQKLRFCVICWVPFGAQHRPKIDIGGFEKY